MTTAENGTMAAVRELLCLATVLQILHDHLAAALYVTLDNRANIVHLPNVLCELSAICLTVSNKRPYD